MCGTPQMLSEHTEPSCACSWGCWTEPTACVCPSDLGRWCRHWWLLPAGGARWCLRICAAESRRIRRRFYVDVERHLFVRCNMWGHTFWWVTWSVCRWGRPGRSGGSRCPCRSRSRRPASCSEWPGSAAACWSRRSRWRQQRPGSRPKPWLSRCGSPRSREWQYKGSIRLQLCYFFVGFCLKKVHTKFVKKKKNSLENILKYFLYKINLYLYCNFFLLD